MAFFDLQNVLSLFSTGIEVVGALRQGAAEEKAHSFNDRVARENADIAREQAALDAAQIDRLNRQRLGAARAAAGAAGAQSEDVLDVFADIFAQGELDKQQALYQGELRARGAQNTARLERFSGKQAKRGSYFAAGSALLSGGYQTYSNWLKRV